MNRMNKKIVVTGMGMVSALGTSVAENWDNLVQGKSGITPITKMDTSEVETHIAAQVDDKFEDLIKDKIQKRQRKQMTRSVRVWMASAIEAVEDANIDFENYDCSKAGVIVGIIDTSTKAEEDTVGDSHLIVRTMPNSAPAWISMRYGLKGPSFNVSTACASAAYAVSVAAQLIESGLCDMFVVGGVGSTVNYDQIHGFNQIMAMSANNDNPSKACCPFSKRRDGFILGEGAGALVIESEESAKRRNAKIYCELSGYSITDEACDITAPQSDGIGMAECMNKALECAGITPDDVDYINAHGTSTYLNDKYETMAIKSVFGDRAYKIPVSSTKSMLGHGLAASGAFEAITTILSINNGIITPTINYDDPDPELDLDYVPNSARKADINVAISNSFGFGGHNSTLVFSKYREK